MKRIRIIQAVVLLAVVFTMASCSSGRHYPVRTRTDVSLIIGSSPGLVVVRHPDGRYYYRGPHGYIYWRGYGNRYYLDRRYVQRSYYNHYQYRDWKRYHNYGRHGRRR